MKGTGGRPRGATLRTLIVGGTAAFVFGTCLTLGGLLVLVTGMRATLDREARVFFAEQQTAAAIIGQVERQLLNAADYLNDPSSAALDQFRKRGQEVYALERQYLFRDLSLRERLQVERVKELHQALEVLAQAAFDARRRGDATAAGARAAALFRASEPVQQALDGFLAMRAEHYEQARRHQAAVIRRLYVGAALTIALLLVAMLLAVRVVRRRILAPVDALARAAGRVGAGDLSVRVELPFDDELSHLAATFNAMTAGLERLQGELRESEARNRRLVELTPDAIIVHDADRIRLGNPGAVRLFGAASAGELTGRRLLDFLHPDAPPMAADQLRAALVDGARATSVELPFRRVDGGEVLGELIAAPFDFEGRPASLVAVRDVTARRQAEEALRATEDRLRQSQKIEAVGRLAGGIAHDFNNLLTVIHGNLEFVTHDLPRDHPTQGDLAEIRAATDRTRTLVRQLLAFSRKQVLAVRQLDVNTVVRDAERLLRRIIGEEITLQVALSPEALIVEADPGQLEQVLLNLAINARDAMLTPLHGRPGTGGALTIEADAFTLTAAEAPAWNPLAPGRYVRLTVRDTGPGMDAATLSHAFEPFFTTKPLGEGTGLGLASVYGVVAQSGGGVRVHTAPGEGATFVILLPAIAAAPVEAAADVPLRAIDFASGVASRDTETVLLVEDERAVRAATRRLLERQGYTVLEARHGADALLVWREHGDSIDAVVTDVRMPEVGGREFVSALHAEAPTLPVVYISGYLEQATVTALRPHEAFVEKPFAGEALLRALARVLAGSPRTVR